MQKIIKYLDFIIYWSIVGIPFSIAIAPAITYTLIGFMFSSFLLKKIIKKEKLFIHTPINLPFLCLALISVISFRNSIDYIASFRGIARFIQNAFLFLVCAEEVKNRRHINKIILSIILGATLASIDGIWQIIFGKDFIRGHTYILNIGLKRATAAFPNANVFGIYLGAITPLVIGMSLYYFKKKVKFIMLVISLLVTVGLIFTFSRGAALAFYTAVLFIAICRKDKFIVSLLLVFLFTFPLIVPRNIKDWAKSVDYNPIVFMLNADRISIYSNTLNMIRHHPLIGVGVNTFCKNYAKYKLPEAKGAESGDSVYAHNSYLHMAGEIGLLGLGIFICLLFRLFKQAAITYRSLKDEYYKLISLFTTACLIAFLINGLTETNLYYARVAMIFWYMIGFSLSLVKFGNADIPKQD